MLFFSRQTHRTANSSLCLMPRLRLELLEDRCTPSAGALDPTFDGDGVVITDFDQNEAAVDLAMQADGKLVVVGTSQSNNNRTAIALARYHPDGALDTSFSGDGKTTLSFTGGFNFGRDVAIQADGKILVAGVSGRAGGPYDFVVARFRTDGTLDPTFGNKGKVQLDFGGSEVGNAMTIQPDGKILVAGGFAGGQDFAVVRLNANGSLDASFGAGGKATANIVSGQEEFARDVILQPDGKILLVGFTRSFTYRFGLARFNADGSPDTTFGNGGTVLSPHFGSDNFASSAALQDDGKIVVAGIHSAGLAVARYHADGSVDTSFGGDGLVTWGGVNIYHENGTRTEDVVVQPDGKIVVTAGVTDIEDGFTIRVHSDGTPDSTFGTDGVVMNYGGRGMLLQPDGKIVVAGHHRGDFRLARLDGDSAAISAMEAAFASLDLNSVLAELEK